MTSPLDALVSGFRSATSAVPGKPMPLALPLERIKSGTFQPQIADLRTLLAREDTPAYDQAKKKLPAFTPAGVFTRRANAGLTAASGLVHFDFDHPPNLAAAKARLMEDPWIVYVFTSPSGAGLKVAVWADGIVDDRTYKHAWTTVLAYFEKTYPDLAVANDKACKDVARLCFVSHDPDLYSNPNALLYVVPGEAAPGPKPTQTARTTRSPRAQPQAPGESEQARVENALQWIPTDSYDLWLRVGMALHASGEPWARGLWDTWSQGSNKYDAQVQEQKWNGFTPDGGVTLGTIFHEARQYGYAPPPGATLGVGAPSAPGSGGTLPPRPKIIIGPEIAEITDAAEDALLHLPGAPVVYQRARGLCVIAYGAEAPKWLHRPEDAPIAVDASSAQLRELIGHAASWWKLDKRAKQYEQALPPVWVVDTLQGRVHWPFPPLEGIVYSPTLRPDGSVLRTPGYDPASGLFLATNGTAYPPIPDQPTLDEARTAIGALQEPFIDFLFAAAWHFSAALAAILSLVCRFAVMGNVPLFAIRANTRASGKSLLADVVSIIGTGRAAPRWPQVTEEEEERKRLLTVALAGYPVIHIDNVRKPLGSPALDLALTASSFSDRMLGKNESREAPLSLVWLASGNNMQFKGDTARRIVPIDLDTKMERPEERTGFQHAPLPPWVRQERPRLTIAALTLVKAYFAAGCPSQRLTPMGSFEAWSDLVRQALVWAGEADPCEGRKDIEAESDPDYERLAALLGTWEACYPIPPGKTCSAGKELREVVAEIAALKKMDKPLDTPPKPNTPNEYDRLQDALGAFDERYDGKGLRSGPVSNRLRVVQGRMIGKTRLISMGKTRTNTTLWGIETL